ncbi:hypothetical protein AA15973_2294 [Komagataeibacter sucrofermentans DSM 15973]|nr:hypothetical protein AA15973_2294 [Komagataeibacter sucrofermentans DSM 15973]
MDFTHQFGAREVQDLGAVFLPPVITLDLKVQKLYARTHPAVTQQDLIAEGIEKVRASGHGYPEILVNAGQKPVFAAVFQRGLSGPGLHMDWSGAFYSPNFPLVSSIIGSNGKTP